LEQWGSCTHWTEDRNIACRFAKLSSAEVEQCVPVIFVLPYGAMNGDYPVALLFTVEEIPPLNYLAPILLDALEVVAVKRACPLERV